MRKHYTTAQRAELMSLVRSGQASPRQAAAQMGVPASTAYNWLRAGSRPGTAVALAARARASAAGPGPMPPPAPPAFARLVRAVDGTSLLLLRVGEVTLEVRPGFDAPLLRRVIAALTEPTS